MTWEFSETISNLRKARGWSQEKLAEKLNISRQAVAKWENGINYPDIFRVFEIADIFEVSVRSLIPDCEYTNNYSALLDSISRDYLTIVYANLDSGDVLYVFCGHFPNVINTCSVNTRTRYTNCFDPGLQDMQEKVILPEDRDIFFKNMQPEVIKHKFEGQDEFSFRYRVTCYAEIQYMQTTVRKTSNYKETHNFIAMVKKVPQEIINLKTQQMYFDTLCKQYCYIYFFDLLNDDFECIKPNNRVSNVVLSAFDDKFYGRVELAEKATKDFMNRYVVSEDFDAFSKNTNLKYIRGRLDLEECFSFTFKTLVKKKTESYKMTAIRIGDNGDRYIACFENISK